MRRSEGRFPLAVAAAHGDQLPGLHELEQHVVDDARGQVEAFADLVRRQRPPRSRKFRTTVSITASSTLRRWS